MRPNAEKWEREGACMVFMAGFKVAEEGRGKGKEEGAF